MASNLCFDRLSTNGIDNIILRASASLREVIGREVLERAALIAGLSLSPFDWFLRAQRRQNARYRR